MQTETQINLHALLSARLHGALEEFEDWRLDIESPLSPADVDGHLKAYDYLLEDVETQVAQCDYQRVKPEVHALLTTGSIQLPEDGPEIRHACREYLKADAEVIRR